MAAAAEELRREITALQTQMGIMQAKINEGQQTSQEKMDRQTAAMNLVVQEAKGQFAQMKAEQTQVVNDAQTKFQETSAAVDAIWKGCEKSGSEVREFAQKVEQ